MGLRLVHQVQGRVFGLLHERVGLIYLQQSFQINAYDLGAIQICLVHQTLAENSPHFLDD